MKIYLIDDDDSLRNSLRELLQRHGHEVRVAKNGLDIDRLLAEWDAELVICDMLMPGAEGFEVLRRVRDSKYRDIRFIMISGASGDLSGFLERAPLLGANAILQKPFTPSELLDLIETIGSADRRGGSTGTGP